MLIEWSTLQGRIHPRLANCNAECAVLAASWLEIKFRSASFSHPRPVDCRPYTTGRPLCVPRYLECRSTLLFLQVFEPGKWIVRSRRPVAALLGAIVRIRRISEARVFVVVTIDAQELPVAAILRIVIMVVITMMHREFVHVRMGEFAHAATANPGVHFEGLLTVSLLTLAASPSGVGNDAVQFFGFYFHVIVSDHGPHQTLF